MVRDDGPVERAPEPACRRDWVPIEAPMHRRSPKYEDEPVRRDGAAEPLPVAVNDRLRGDDLPDGAGVVVPDGGDVDA